MVKIIILWVASISLSWLASYLKELYDPTQDLRNILLTLYMSLVLIAQLATIYYTASKSPFMSMIAIIAFTYYWLSFPPLILTGDAAGVGMARGFAPIINGVAALIFGIIAYLLIKFLSPAGLYISLVISIIIGFANIISNSHSLISGASVEQDASFYGISKEDYLKAKFRESMIEEGDPWDAMDLDASPEEVDSWKVGNCHDIILRSYQADANLYLKGRFAFLEDTLDIDEPIIHDYFFKGEHYFDQESTKSYIPRDVYMAWYDRYDGKIYQLSAQLPDSLSHYFDDAEKYKFDNVYFYVMPKGKVVMFHKRRREIHNIMIGEPLQGEETTKYNDVAKRFFQENNIKATKSTKLPIPSLETINNYLKRFNYTVSFTSADKQYKISKTICNFFNGERILSDNTWREKMQPARLKDVFLRFNNQKDKYSCFVFFNEEEILKAFDHVFSSADNTSQAEFNIKIGTKLDAFEFTLKAGNRSYTLKNTEIRLYKNNSRDKGELVFKNYKGKRQNVLKNIDISIELRRNLSDEDDIIEE